MSNISRDSFKETQNTLNDLRGLASPRQQNPKHYVGIRLQQGVPIIDADWNEMEDIRRLELETVLARAIGSGVPAGSNGFRIQPQSPGVNFTIEHGLLFLDGWLVYNPATVSYPDQPHRESAGLASPLLEVPEPLVAHRDLVYLDAWELEVDSEKDSNLLNPWIGVESCTRLQRAWVARFTAIAANADPLAPATIPNRLPRHRYYALATIDWRPGSELSEGMISDLRRTQLTLDALTFAPLFIRDVARDQILNSSRLAGTFRGNLDAMQGVLARAPETLVYVGHDTQSWQAMTAFNDVRASAVSFEQEALAEILHRKAALAAMKAFYKVQKNLVTILQGISAGGVGVVPIGNFLKIYRRWLDGANPTDTSSLKFALDADDLLGAVLAQERLNEELAAQSNALPEGTVGASLISITPTGGLANKTVTANYQLTIGVKSQLVSELGSERIRVIASAGPGWNLQFTGSQEADQKEIVIDIPNLQSRDVVLNFSADPGAANTSLNLTVRPERRQQLVSTNPPITLALGQEVLPAQVIASLGYEGPTLQPGNRTPPISRSAIFGAGLRLSFGIKNLSPAPEVYLVTVRAINPANGDPVAANGWQQPVQPVLPSLNANAANHFDVTFKTTNQFEAISPVTWRIQLTKVTGGANEPLVYTRFDLTIVLQVLLT